MIETILLFTSLVAMAAPSDGERMASVGNKLRPVPFTAVRIADSFWAPRLETNRRVSLKHSLDMLEKAGNVRNFELAAAGRRNGYSGPVFMDSDLYKTLEAVSYSLATHPDADLEKRVDRIIAKVAAAQMPDGYLNTHFQVKEPERRWTNLRDAHELYCAGHLIEAAVSHSQATGKRTLLDVARKFADHIAARFGAGKKRGYPGHPEIELALVKLWKATGERRYFDLARFFVEERGTGWFAAEHNTPADKYDGTYWQDDIPIYEHNHIKGHAVRAAYLLSGVVDVAAETGDARLREMVHRVWNNTTRKRMYVTGGIGPSAHNEGFTEDYDLPNRSAYQETCASVAMVLWAHRLNLLTGESHYFDLLERSLYNGALAGVSLDGRKFFYVNPLSSAGTHHRSDWFGCACCPPNIARLLASLGGYAYASSDDSVWVNLYVQGGAEIPLKRGKVNLDVETEYPWEGRVSLRLTLREPMPFTLRLRMPGWCRSAELKVNGKSAEGMNVADGYLAVDRTWQAGDSVELSLAMPVEHVEAHPRAADNPGKLAIQRGPLIYCLEQRDQEAPVTSIALPRDAKLEPLRDTGALGGMVALRGTGFTSAPAEWGSNLYRFAEPPRAVTVTAIPYFAWDNREAGPMEAWIPVIPPAPPAAGPAALAKVTVSFQSDNAQPMGINDGITPKDSGDHPGALCHWWPRKGTEEWVQYTWDRPLALSGSRVYWFDDTGRGECRPPDSWQIQYLDNGAWKPVEAAGGFPVALNRWCAVEFKPVTTTSVRILLKLQPGWAAGIHEWTVEAAP